MNKRAGLYLFMMLFIIMTILLSRLNEIFHRRDGSRQYYPSGVSDQVAYDTLVNVTIQKTELIIAPRSNTEFGYRGNTEIHMEARKYPATAFLYYSGGMSVNPVDQQGVEIRSDNSGFWVNISNPTRVSFVFSDNIPIFKEEPGYFSILDKRLGLLLLKRWSPFSGRKWMVCKDGYSDRINEWETTVHVPANYRVIASGKLVEEHSGEKETVFCYRNFYPVLPSAIGLAVGQYEQYTYVLLNQNDKKCTLSFWKHKNLETQLPENFEETIFRIFQFLESELGPYPFPENGVHIVEAPGKPSAAHSMIFINFVNPYWEYDLVRNLALQWLYFDANPDLRAGWFSSGGSEFLLALYSKTYEGESPFRNLMMERKPNRENALTTPLNFNTDSLLYDKAYLHQSVWLMNYLYSLLGEEDWKKFIRNILKSGRQQEFIPYDRIVGNVKEMLPKNWSEEEKSRFIRYYLEMGSIPKLNVSIIRKNTSYVAELSLSDSIPVPLFITIREKSGKRRGEWIGNDPVRIMEEFSDPQELLDAIILNYCRVNVQYQF